MDDDKYYNQCREKNISTISEKKLPYYTFHKHSDLKTIYTNNIPDFSNKVYSFDIFVIVNSYDGIVDTCGETELK